jgi:hypothetical protein
MASWTEVLPLLVSGAGAVTGGGRAWSASRSRKRGVTCSYPEVPSASIRHRPVRTAPDATSWSLLIPVEQADAGAPDGRRSSPQGARATAPGSRTRDQIGCANAQQARGRWSADRQEDYQELRARAGGSPSAAARGALGGGDLGGAIPLDRSARSRASPQRLGRRSL